MWELPPLEILLDLTRNPAKAEKDRSKDDWLDNGLKSLKNLLDQSLLVLKVQSLLVLKVFQQIADSNSQLVEVTCHAPGTSIPPKPGVRALHGRLLPTLEPAWCRASRLPDSTLTR